MARLQRLPQNLQYFAVELWKLIEKQNTVVGEGNFTRLRFRAAVGFLNSCESTRLEAARCGF